MPGVLFCTIMRTAAEENYAADVTRLRQGILQGRVLFYVSLFKGIFSFDRR